MRCAHAAHILSFTIQGRLLEMGSSIAAAEDPEWYLIAIPRLLNWIELLNPPFR